MPVGRLSGGGRMTARWNLAARRRPRGLRRPRGRLRFQFWRFLLRYSFTLAVALMTCCQATGFFFSEHLPPDLAAMARMLS